MCCIKPPLRVAVAMDKFKGCLSAMQANRAVTDGLARAFGPRPDALRVAALPMADGGDGTAAVLAMVDPDVTAVDMAACCGVAGRDLSALDPDGEDSSALGHEVMRLFREGCGAITVALGGSRSIDGGAGFLQALGFTLTDGSGRPLTGIPCGASLRRVAAIQPPAHPLPRLTMLADVTAPLAGREGAVRSYGPQKGLTADRYEAYERGLLHWAALTGADPATSGAAGGMPCAAAVLRTYGCRVVEGGKYLAERVAGALMRTLGGIPDLWITGEGRSDAQTLQGKAPFALMQAARALRPDAAVALLSGEVTDPGMMTQVGFATALSINPPDASPGSRLAPGVASARLCHTAQTLLRKNGQQYIFFS